MAVIESMTMRELRNTRKLEAKLQAGKIIELRKRNRPFARIMPLAEHAALWD
jgi:antitoxin (DNA-binding transcriptional repressor) of toxin-antitoxin stability system